MQDSIHIPQESWEYESISDEESEAFDPELTDKEWAEEVRQLRAARPVRAQRPVSRLPRRPKRPYRPIIRPPRPSWPIAYEPIAATGPDSGSQANEYVRWVQTTLNQVLNLQLPVDGILDVQTRSAIRSFQEKKGLPITGIVGPDTEHALIATRNGQFLRTGVTKPDEPVARPPAPGTMAPAEPAPTSPAAEFDFSPDFNETFEDRASIFESSFFEISKPKLSKRNRPGYIKWVQISLNKALGLKLVTDGKMGTQTRSAIRDFQKKLGLKADGIVGRKTERALIKANYPMALNISKIKSVRITSQKPKKVEAQPLIQSLSKLSEVGIEIDPVNAITTILNNEGDIDWELDQMKEAKHPWNQEKWGAGIWTSKSVVFEQGMSTVLGDEISAKFRVNYKYNGHSVGYFYIVGLTLSEANKRRCGGCAVLPASSH